MNSAPDSSYGLDSASPLELALDRAMDRYWAAEETQRLGQRDRRRAAAGALAVTSGQTALATLPPRLQWRGIDVSPEFQEYAARVARGEQLAPYRGQVLARPCPDFPWGPAAHVRRETERPLVGRSTRITAVLLSAGAALMAAVGVGSGTAERVDDELDGMRPEQSKSALRPAPYVVLDEPSASAGSAEPPASPRDTVAADSTAAPSRRARSAPRRRGAPSALAATAHAASAAPSPSGAPGGVAGEQASDGTPVAEETFGLDELGVGPVGSEPTSAGAEGSTARGTAQRTASASSRESSKPHLGMPTDWDPTGNMSILFSDDVPF